MPLKAIQSDELRPLAHGFFTRSGGASSGQYDGLNCGLASADDPKAVHENRARVANALSAKTLATVKQVHGSAVHRTRKSGDCEGVEADALVTDQPGLAIGILTADCQPVLFADTEAGVIAAAHAGWRGAVDGILENTVLSMEELGAKRSRITAVIGPTISQAAYEVGPEFLDTFLAADPDNSQFFANGQGDRYLFDLPSYGLAKLRALGIKHAEWTRHCTFQDEARFYSYRRATKRGEPDYGRLLSAICL